MGIFKSVFRDAARLLFRHWGLSLLTLVTAIAVFFMIGGSLLFMVNARYMVSRVEGELLIQAYVREDSELEPLAKQVSEIKGVASVKPVTVQEALGRLKNMLQENEQALAILGENPLPPSLEIRVARASDVSLVARELLALPVVQDVVYAGKLAEKMMRISRFAAEFSVALLVISITASALVLFNTIRISVYSRREEIGVMLLVGGTSTFVSLPFVIQGMVLGGLGSFGAVFLLMGAYEALVTGVESTIPFLDLVSDPKVLLQLAGLLVGGGVTVGWISSWLAVDRFIRKSLQPL